MFAVKAECKARLANQECSCQVYTKTGVGMRAVPCMHTLWQVGALQGGRLLSVMAIWHLSVFLQAPCRLESGVPSRKNQKVIII